MCRSRVMIVVVLSLATWSAREIQAQTRNNNKKAAAGSSPMTWAVGPILEGYVKQMTRTYNLNTEQEEYTRLLLNQRVKGFLNDYEKDLRLLFTEYQQYQMNRELPSVEAAKDLSNRMSPLVAAVRREIFDGNMKWREILNDKQRKQHDKDLKLMEQQFDRFEDQMRRWKRGEVKPEDMNQRREITDRAPAIRKFEDVWDYRVRTFIENYNLSSGQRETAYSILRELKEEAGRYRDKHREEFSQLESQFATVSGGAPKTDPEELKKVRARLKELHEQLTKLEEPIRVDMWRQLLNRLQRIPTEDQRRQREAQLAKLRRAGGLDPTGNTSQPASAPTESQPATAQE